MMTGLAPVQLETTAISGSVKLKGNGKRRYLAIYSDTDVTITIDETPFVLKAGIPFSPVPCPTNAMTIAGSSGIIMEG